MENMSKLLTFEVISEGEIKVKIGNILLGYIFRSINKTTNRYFKFIANMQSLEYEELCEIVEKMNDIEQKRSDEMVYSRIMGDGQTIAYKILGILHHIAPNGEAQNICTRMFNSIPDGFERDKVMSCALTDGYLYGNWPWELEKLNTKG
jgi:hypothetical protein